MDCIRIVGGKELYGEISISGSKNAALPLLAASLLTDGTLRLNNLPNLADITSMIYLIEKLGVKTEMISTVAPSGELGRIMELNGGDIRATTAPYDVVRKMRASILVLGPLLARKQVARVSLPGGCAIGSRPVDLHLKAMEQLGAKIELTEGYINAVAPAGLTGAHVNFPSVTVGGTENILMAATLAKGETKLSNAAREPEIADLAHCLIAMGAKIDGIGTNTLYIQGVDHLNGANHTILPDRIEAGTYAVAAAITCGNILLRGTRVDLMSGALSLLTRAGVSFSEEPGGIRVSRSNKKLIGVDLMTEPFPGFPTDMQAQFMALMSIAEGASMITETIFENRFMHAPELSRMGADINIHGASAIIRGVPALSGAPVMATDLRASVSLVLAGLAAKGETIVSRVYHLDRGYERLEEKLALCGAEICRLTD